MEDIDYKIVSVFNPQKTADKNDLLEKKKKIKPLCCTQVTDGIISLSGVFMIKMSTEKEKDQKNPYRD